MLLYIQEPPGFLTYVLPYQQDLGLGENWSTRSEAKSRTGVNHQETTSAEPQGRVEELTKKLSTAELTIARLKEELESSNGVRCLYIQAKLYIHQKSKKI